MKKITIAHLNFNLPAKENRTMHQWQILDETTLDIFSISITPLISYDPINFPIDEVEESLMMKTGTLPYAIEQQPQTDKFYSIGRTGKVLKIEGKEKENKSLRVA